MHLGKIDKEIVCKRIEEQKEKIIGKLNKNRKDTHINEKFIKTTVPDKIKNKLVPKHKEVKVIKRNGKKYVLSEGNRFKKNPNRIVHKDQFAKLKRFNENISVHRNSIKKNPTNGDPTDTSSMESNEATAGSSNNYSNTT